jgi:hypothetical protein
MVMSNGEMQTSLIYWCFCCLLSSEKQYIRHLVSQSEIIIFFSGSPGTRLWLSQLLSLATFIAFIHDTRAMQNH